MFWKSISSHTHAFYSLCSMFFQKPGYFFKNSVFPKFQLIQSVFRSIEIAFKILCEPLSVSINRNWFSINRNWFSINRKSWISFFKKRQILTYSNLTFQKFLNFSLSLSLRFELGSTSNFCRFLPKFLQGFPLSKSVCPYYPLLFSYIQFYMHFFMHWRFIFRLCINWAFWCIKPYFVKLINGFCC